MRQERLTNHPGGRGEETRPRGYLPAKDNPDVDRDAVGENNQDPSREKVSDAGKIKGE